MREGPLPAYSSADEFSSPGLRGDRGGLACGKIEGGFRRQKQPVFDSAAVTDVGDVKAFEKESDAMSIMQQSLSILQDMFSIQHRPGIHFAHELVQNQDRRPIFSNSGLQVIDIAIPFFAGGILFRHRQFSEGMMNFLRFFF